jgi:diguanylate cyclase (GGDEF)-like protein/PAS domain S-box-containing protein
LPAFLTGDFTGDTQVPKTILLIQDNAADARSVQAALLGSTGEAVRIERVRRCSEAVERLNGKGEYDDGIDAVLVDLSLPDSQGIDTFEQLYSVAPHTPILILSAPHDEEIAKLAVQRGAQDYLLLQSCLDGDALRKALRSMIERAAIAEALFTEQERAQVTLDSIGDAVISTDAGGFVTYVNAVAEGLTGWPRKEAAGRPLAEVFRIVSAGSREVAPDPMGLAIREDRTVGLTPNCILIRRDGVEMSIEDSVAPIHDRRGKVTGAVMVFRDVTAAQAMSRKMSHLAQHDSVTDLPNRVLLNDRLVQAMAMAQRNGKKLALLYLDVDHFKHINDTAGHAVGDQLLQSISKRLLDCVRSSDTVSRQGGDEFAVLLSEVAYAQDAAVTAEKILAALSAAHKIDELELYVSASIGIVVYPGDGTTAETLLKNADAAMYQAKDCGRNNYQFFRAEMNRHIFERQALESDLHRALDRHEFTLHYQPKVNLRSGTIVGVEALLRWHHPTRRLIGPTRFISIAEDSGLIVPIGKWVLREGCRQAKIWQAAGLAPVKMAVNVSAVELRAKNFVSGVREILADTGLDARYLELEITEAFLRQDPLSTQTVLQELKDTGVQLALDDFGTGYSSLSCLKRFPIDTLKIDGSFVGNLTADAGDAGIVSAVVNMGRNMDVCVVAEGVETPEQFEFLKHERCPEAQGNYFFAPMNPGAITELLAQTMSA